MEWNTRCCRFPVVGPDLASQPALSCFESSVLGRGLLRTGIRVDMALFPGRGQRLNRCLVLMDVKGSTRRIHERLTSPRGDAEGASGS